MVADVVPGAPGSVVVLVVVVAGLVAPLILQFGELTGKIRHTMAPALLVLVGGFALRWILVSAGQASHW